MLITDHTVRTSPLHVSAATSIFIYGLKFEVRHHLVELWSRSIVLPIPNADVVRYRYHWITTLQLRPSFPTIVKKIASCIAFDPVLYKRLTSAFYLELSTVSFSYYNFTRASGWLVSTNCSLIPDFTILV